MCACIGPVAGQRPHRQLPNRFYHFHKITQAEGLSSYNVKRVLQDGYGYTWIATQAGLNRFDGKNITIYNTSADSPRQLVNNDIWDLAADSTNNRLWVLTYTGLNCIDLATGKVLDNPSGLKQVLDLVSNSGSNFKCELLVGERLWIGSQNLGFLTVFNTRTGKPDSVERLPSIPGTVATLPNVDRIWADGHGRIWVFVANYGIVIYSAGSRRIVERHSLAELRSLTERNYFDSTQGFDRFRGAVQIGPDRMALLTNDGFFDVGYGGSKPGAGSVPKLRIKSFILSGDAALRTHTVMYSCTTDPGGNLWFSSENALFRMNVSTGEVTRIEDADYSNPDNWFAGIYHIYFDRGGHLWLGTQKGLAFSPVTSSPFLYFFQSADHQTTINHANYVYPYRDSLLYICAEDGFYRVRLKGNIIRRLAAGRYFSAITLKDGRLLVGGEKNLFVLRADTLANAEVVYPELRPIAHKLISTVIWCGDTLAMGGFSDYGVFRWDPRQHKVDSLNSRMRSRTPDNSVVYGLYRDHRGRIWILSATGCSIYDPAREKIDTTFHLDDPNVHLPATFYFDVAESKGLYWIAIYGTGVIGIDSNLKQSKVYSTREGLANDGVYKLIPWRDSLLFVSSNNGLAMIRLDDSSVINYFQKDGLQGNGFELGCGYLSQNYIYTGGDRGVTQIEPDRIPSDPVAPPLRIGNVRMQTTGSVYAIGDLSAGMLEVPSDVVRTSLTVATFDYTDEGRTVVAYRIPELKTQWIPLGSDQTIDLLSLSPGKYTLLVRAVNPNATPRERQLTIDIRWLPKWYQTIWFDIGVALAVLIIFYSFYLYRVSTIRQQQLIRQNISSDLHDDIGSTLNTIKIYTQLARRGTDTENWLTQIDSSLGHAVVALRDMIWVLDDSQDTVYQFLERLQQFAKPATTAHGIGLDIAAEGDATWLLRKEEKRNLLLIAKETVNNSIKYARCTQIVIRMQATGKSLMLQIADDGIGFDPDRATDGNGLKNIRRRAARINCVVAIESGPDAGTRIRLQRSTH